MPKKPPRNAFYFFMVDFREQEKAKGRAFCNGLQEVSVAASPIWNAMTPNQKQKYETIAKREKEKNNVPEKKFTTTGESIADVERQLREQQMLQERERTDITTLVRNKLVGGELLPEEFQVFCVNYYCQTASDLFIPCEVALATFSVQNGITDIYHTLIDPGRLPLGFASEVKDRYDKTGMEAPPVDGSINDYGYILSHITARLERQNEKRFRPLFTFPVDHHIDAGISFIKQCCDYADEDPGKYRVYSLNLLAFHLMKALAKRENEGFLSEHQAFNELNKDPHENTVGLACEFHADKDMGRVCTLSKVKRWAYGILDWACPIANIKPLIPGKHILPQIDLEAIESYKTMRVQGEIENIQVPKVARQWDAASKFDENAAASPDSFVTPAGDPGAWPTLGSSAKASSSNSKDQRVRMPRSLGKTLLTSDVSEEEPSSLAIKKKLGKNTRR